MSFDQIIVILLVVYAFGLALMAVLNILGSGVYDLRATKQRRLQQAQPHARRYRQRPLVSVIVVAQNHQADIVACLESLNRSSYRKLELLIVDNASRDDTKAVIKNYLTEHPKLPARLVAKRKPAAWTEAWRRAYRSYGHGEVLVVLGGNAVLERSALRAVVTRLNDEPNVEILKPRRQPTKVATLGGLWQSYLAFLSHRSLKTASVLGRTDPGVGAATFFRRSRLERRGKPAAQARYAHDVIVKLSAAGLYYRQQPAKLANWSLARVIAAILRLCSGITTLLTPFLLSYFIFLAIGLKEPLFLLVSLAAIALIIISAVWEDQELRFRQRLAYCLGIPVTYSLFYATSWVRLIKACRDILSPLYTGLVRS